MDAGKITFIIWFFFWIRRGSGFFSLDNAHNLMGGTVD